MILDPTKWITGVELADLYISYIKKVPRCLGRGPIRPGRLGGHGPTLPPKLVFRSSAISDRDEPTSHQDGHREESVQPSFVEGLPDRHLLRVHSGIGYSWFIIYVTKINNLC